ncbi:MAG: UDP-N-acetylmuramate dehydrogenase [Myxococcales bacterium]|nr:UDP-N-acetylmuramate dehydrogenase [Myxococcales bacterium]
MTTIPPAFRSFVSENEPLSRHTTLAVGGPARWFARVDGREDLRALVRHCGTEGIALIYLGAGSNVLVSDRGFTGCVVRLGGAFCEIDHEVLDARAIVRAGAAVKLGKLLRYGFDHGLCGLQSCAGIPGTVGGAVMMNAGSKLGEMKDSFLDCELLHRDGLVEVRDREAMRFAYRTSSIGADELVLSARFNTTRGPVDALRDEVERFLEFRKATQPLQFHNCGSVFSNPPGDAAGRLIEACGLKGARVGGAEIAEQHANWILNRGAATATDVLALIQLARNSVRERFGVVLHTELRLLGDWTADEIDSIRETTNDTSYSRGGGAS